MRDVPLEQEQAATSPEKAEYNVTQPLELAYPDLTRAIYPESLDGFQYIDNLPDEYRNC